MKLIVMIALTLLASACTPSDYAIALDKCALSHPKDRPATLACQCNVSKQFGQSCDWTNEDGGQE